MNEIILSGPILVFLAVALIYKNVSNASTKDKDEKQDTHDDMQAQITFNKLSMGNASNSAYLFLTNLGSSLFSHGISLNGFKGKQNEPICQKKIEALEESIHSAEQYNDHLIQKRAELDAIIHEKKAIINQYKHILMSRGETQDEINTRSSIQIEHGVASQLSEALNAEIDIKNEIEETDPHSSDLDEKRSSILQGFDEYIEYSKTTLAEQTQSLRNVLSQGINSSIKFFQPNTHTTKTNYSNVNKY